MAFGRLSALLLVILVTGSTFYIALYKSSIKFSRETNTTCSPLSLQMETFMDETEDVSASYDFQLEKPQPVKNTKIVLWFDTHGKTMVNFSTKATFDGCQYSNCKFKHYLTRENPVLHRPFDVDAILVQSAGIFTNSPPPRRNGDQVFVFAVRDAFGGSNRINKSQTAIKWMSVFNWTMTYRLDSDIVFKYSSILNREDTNCLKGKDYDRIFEEKLHSALWVVSQCKTVSQREHYVKALRQVFDVSIYGACGQKAPCPKGNFKCFEELASKHKFYLAFENTFYEDYVTEKVYNWFNKDIIIVVRGGSNYSRILPPGTVIDAADFKSARDLGLYLDQLGNDKKRYTEFLRQKDKFYTTHKLVEAHNANCKLCEYLNNLDSHRKSYTNIANWWLQNWRNDGLTKIPLEGFNL